MKKRALRALAVIFLVLVFSALISSLEIKTSKDSFMQGETFLASLSGNIKSEIADTDVGFYEGHVQKPVSFDLIKLGSTYYIYANMPITGSEKTYILKISNVYFIENSKPVTKDIEKSFTITNETAPFNINPGFDKISNKDFSILLSSHSDSDLSITSSLGDYSNSISLTPQESNKEAIVSIQGIIYTNITELILQSDDFTYNLPVYIITNKTLPQPPIDLNETNQTQINNTNQTANITANATNQTANFIGNNSKLAFIPSNSINATLNKSTSLYYTITIKNIGTNETGLIYLSISPELKNYTNLSAFIIGSIPPKNETQINLTAKFDAIGNYKGYVSAVSNYSSDRFYAEFKVRENAKTNISTYQSKTCSSIGGIFCKAEESEICDSFPISAYDGSGCCVGACVNPNPPASRNWIAVVVILVILALIGVFFWFKTKKSKSPSSKAILNKKSKDFDERFETSGKLTKI